MGIWDWIDYRYSYLYIDCTHSYMYIDCTPVRKEGYAAQI